MWPFNKITLGATPAAIGGCNRNQTFIQTEDESVSVRIIKASNGHIVQSALINNSHGSTSQEHIAIVPEGGSLIDAIAASLVSLKLE